MTAFIASVLLFLGVWKFAELATGRPRLSVAVDAVIIIWLVFNATRAVFDSRWVYVAVNVAVVLLILNGPAIGVALAQRWNHRDRSRP